MVNAYNEQMFRGFEGEVFVDGDKVGRCETFSFSVTNNISKFFEMGSRIAVEAKEGNLDVEGTLRKGFINGALVRLALGKGNKVGANASGVSSGNLGAAGRLTEFTVKGSVTNVATGETRSGTLTGVKIESWSSEIPQNDWVMEESSFIAQNFKYDDTA